MTTAYFDCFSGAAGDMIVGSLIDAGADFEALTADLATLGLEGYSIRADRVDKRGIAATHFVVELDKSLKQPHRHLHNVVEIIERGRFNDSSKKLAIDVFTKLAEAEATVHGTTIEKVHFHEVGAVDAILDIVGACIARDMLGITRVFSSAIPTGSGTVNCEHGIMPVPAPATANLLRGVPIVPSDSPGELTTPTGAAILRTWAESFGPMPAMIPLAVGYGAGTRQGDGLPNTVRIFLGSGEPETAAGCVSVLETNIDDTSPEVVSWCMERLMAEGALDVYTQPIQMKKSRSGIKLTVLCEPSQSAQLERVVFNETPTFGIRKSLMTRVVLDRRVERIETPFGEIRMKIGEFDGTLTASPEFEDCREAARQHGASLRDVMETAKRSWASLH